MKRIFTVAIALAAIALAGGTPARATTFPELTTIYVASGVVDTDSSSTMNVGIMTVVSCTNMSGQTASVRYVFRHVNAAIAAGGTLLVGSLASKVVTTQGSTFFAATALPTSYMFGGSLQILSTQSAVYCSAMLLDAAGTQGLGGPALHMVRFNPHPGTVE